VYAHLGLDLLTVSDLVDIGTLPEEGGTYAENAAAKAIAVAAATGVPALADDSGIEIDALQGAPGPHSRRFLGEEATDMERNAWILAHMTHVPDAGRAARYRAAVAVALPRGGVRIFEGTCEGAIARSPRGRFGFGYDPIFLVREYGQTMAELPPDVKNRISHRARALRAAEPYVVELLRLGRKIRPRKDQSSADANTEGVPDSSSGGHR
jgi:XTP/dITP diphosphohydrolase